MAKRTGKENLFGLTNPYMKEIFWKTKFKALELSIGPVEKFIVGIGRKA